MVSEGVPWGVLLDDALGDAVFVGIRVADTSRVTVVLAVSLTDGTTVMDVDRVPVRDPTFVDVSLNVKVRMDEAEDEHVETGNAGASDDAVTLQLALPVGIGVPVKGMLLDALRLWDEVGLADGEDWGGPVHVLVSDNVDVMLCTAVAVHVVSTVPDPDPVLENVDVGTDVAVSRVVTDVLSVTVSRRAVVAEVENVLVGVRILLDVSLAVELRLVEGVWEGVLVGASVAVGSTVADVLHVRVPVGTAVAVVDTLALAVRVPEEVVRPDTVEVAVTEVNPVAVTLPLGLPVGIGVPVRDTLADALRVCDAVGLADSVRDRSPDKDTEAESVTVLTDRAATVGVPVQDTVTVSVRKGVVVHDVTDVQDADSVRETVDVGMGVVDSGLVIVVLTVAVTVGSEVPDVEREGVSVGFFGRVSLGVEDRPNDGVPDEVTVAAPTTGTGSDAVALQLALPDGTTVTVEDGVPDPLRVCNDVVVSDGVDARDLVADAVAVADNAAGTVTDDQVGLLD